eukprot:TRINITY_DN112662_c0_g1_i1.p1 TRINITY_DN112662_c0_g1~~TRINITY_DN112662_c0_g1_i1.p1  ORF type:complete len:144 (-),score=27.40 TRINITY_DN112662_c0_g1_i1:94-525(-)
MSVKVRDLDYVNRRQKLPSVALPPEVRSKLGLTRSVGQDPKLWHQPDGNALAVSSSSSSLTECSGIRERLAQGGESEELYSGVTMVASVAARGVAGAGADWVNPRGHAFVRRGTAAERQASLQEAAKQKRKLLAATVGRSRGL